MNFEKKALKMLDSLTKECSPRNQAIVIGRYEEALKCIKKYEILISRITLVLGSMKTKDSSDACIRDLLAEACDSLFATKKLITDGYLTIPFVLIRRAMEAISLITYFMLYPSKANAWRNGKNIYPKDIRIAHENHVSGGDYKLQKEIYKYFSSFAHIKGSSIPYRQLGDVNEYILGNCAEPSSLFVPAHLLNLIKMWSWLRHVLVTEYGNQLFAADPSLKLALEETTDEKTTEICTDLKEKAEQSDEK